MRSRNEYSEEMQVSVLHCSPEAHLQTERCLRKWVAVGETGAVLQC